VGLLSYLTPAVRPSGFCTSRANRLPLKDARAEYSTGWRLLCSKISVGLVKQPNWVQFHSGVTSLSLWEKTIPNHRRRY
jgi:hypothetical protein